MGKGAFFEIGCCRFRHIFECQSRASPTLVRRAHAAAALVGTRSLSSGRPTGSGLWPARWQAPAGPVGFAHPTTLREVGQADLPAPPKNFPAPASNFPAAAGQIPCPATAGNLLQVTGNPASTRSGTADAAPNRKKIPAKFAAVREVEALAGPPHPNLSAIQSALCARRQ